MKGQNTFTTSKIDQIKKLIADKVLARPDKQKGIRGKIRKLGFHYSDFNSKKGGYTVKDFENLIHSGKIKVIGSNNKSTSASNATPITKVVAVVKTTAKTIAKPTHGGNKKVIKTTTELLSALEKYEKKGKFHFSINDALSLVCNIPKRNDYSDLYVFYSQNKELIYVGISGREDSAGNIIHRQDGLRGRFLTGKQFGDRRSKTFPIQMKLDNISSLEIHWFVTFGDSAKDIPRPIERTIIEAFKMEQGGKRPRWNKKD